MKAIYFTTVFLLVFAVITQLDFISFTFINILFIVGNLLVIFMVYRTLKDLYQTTNKFENWYGDNPREIED